MPSAPDPTASGAVANVTAPALLVPAYGCRPKDTSVPPPGSASPTDATLETVSRPATKSATGAGPPSTEAANTTAPAAVSDGHRPKCEKLPPPGAASPS